MVYGVGIDIENHLRFKKYTDASFNPEHLTLIFSPNELKNYAKAGNYLCYALGFSCKEAFYKALGSDDVALTDIQLVFNDTHNINNTNISFTGLAQLIIQEKGLRVDYGFKKINRNVIFEVILEC